MGLGVGQGNHPWNSQTFASCSTDLMAQQRNVLLPGGATIPLNCRLRHPCTPRPIPIFSRFLVPLCWLQTVTVTRSGAQHYQRGMKLLCNKGDVPVIFCLLDTIRVIWKENQLRDCLIKIGLQATLWRVFWLMMDVTGLLWVVPLLGSGPMLYKKAGCASRKEPANNHFSFIISA